MTLIVVSGAPGTGKSTIARELGAGLRWCVLSLDPVKEALADVPGLGDEDWSNRVGDAAAEVVFRLAADFPDAVAEGWWRRARRDRAVAEFAGAVGQGDVPWVVLADPEGNEFCVLDPRPVYSGTGPVAAVVADCRDPAAVAGFWELATGWVPGDSVAFLSAGSVSLRSPAGVGPYLELLSSAVPRTVKDRIHLDVAPFPGHDQEAAVAALLAAGAVPADVGQGSVSWTVLADPEGSEFCVLRPR